MFRVLRTRPLHLKKIVRTVTFPPVSVPILAPPAAPINETQTSSASSVIMSPNITTFDTQATLSESRKEEAKNIEKKIVQSLKKKKCYRCKVCGNLIMGPDAEHLYEEHTKKCLKSNIFDCSICFKKFTNNRGLKTHLRNTHLVFD